MTSFPIAWHVVDEPTQRVICEVRNLMPDPGDGSVHEASNLTILTYAGDGLWSREEDVYNPMRFARMSVAWATVAQASTGGSARRGRRFLVRMGLIAAPWLLPIPPVASPQRSRPCPATHRSSCTRRSVSHLSDRTSSRGRALP